MDKDTFLDDLASYGADIRGIRSRFMGDTKLFIKCYYDFLKEPAVPALKKAVDDGRLDEAYEPAHTLKGLSGNLGLTPVYDALCILAKLLKSGDAEGAARQLPAVMSAFERLPAAEPGLFPEPSAAIDRSDMLHYIAGISHDIRTPLNSIISMTNFAMENIYFPEKQMEYLRIIRASSDHLLDLVNSLLDLSRIECGHAVIHTRPFSIIELLTGVSDIIRPLCVEKSQTFITDFDSIVDGLVLGDRLKLSQVFFNLLSNAVKFTPEKGAVRFTASELSPPVGERSVLRFVVEDNGIGIAQEDIGKIFEPFIRVGGSRASEIEGSGLGLPICKSFVEAMNGTLTCESEVDDGSTFTVELTLPRAKGGAGEKTKAGSRPALPFVGRRCLLCEDNPTNALIARTILENTGFTVETADNGSAALSRFLSSPAGHFDIIYMDVQMPYMDGNQAATAIRASEHPQGKTIPIIAMTANLFAEEIEETRLAGMNGHIGKPIILLQLIDETSKILDNGG